MKRNVRKAEALKIYLEQWYIMVESGTFRITDISAKREGWGIYTDTLCKDGYISLEQYETWTMPF